MPTNRLWATGVGLIAVLLVQESGVGNPLRCSMRLAPGFRSRTEAILLASGSRDTVATGPGQVVPSEQGGHSGSGAPGPIYGQRFAVARFAGADSLGIARAFERTGDSSVIIVPWDYDAGCAPTRWTSRSAWVPAAEPGTFTVSPRAESLWVSGVPVFDAFVAAMEPYPLSPAFRADDRFAPSFRAASHMTAAQYFELVSAMPTRQDLWENPDAAWRHFLRWRDANPERLGLYPANQAADQLASDVRFRKVVMQRQRMDPVIGGTWRMTVSLDGGTERQFHLRTYPGVSGEWRPANWRPPSPPPDPLEDPPVPEAYEVYAAGSASLETLRTGCRTELLPQREGYMYVIDPPRADGRSARDWRGWIDPRLIQGQFPADSALARFQRDEWEEGRLRRRNARDFDAPARFRVDDDGTMRVEQTLSLADGRSLVLRGERISTTTIACP